jgi:quercetin dioxygenase-like cupin family protein
VTVAKSDKTLNVFTVLIYPLPLSAIPPQLQHFDEKSKTIYYFHHNFHHGNHMTKTILILLLLFVAPGCAHKEIGIAKFPDGVTQSVFRPGSMKWVKCPPNLPKNCEIAILDGHPKQFDLFTIRFRVQKGFKMAPHSHPRDERATVLSGEIAVAFGKDATLKDAKRFGPGDHYINKRGAIHTVWVTKDNTVVQLSGIGPWKANFIR